MALYFLSYDLRNARSYQTLYDELGRLNAVRIVESTWCFNRVNTSTKGLRNHFARLMDGDDGLVVSEVGEWASQNADGTPNEL